jgi:Tol biopolymer transport system component
MSLSPVTRLGPYEILAPIGAGGMGEVFRARDTRLNREVAIKVTGGRFSDRFEREAHSIAALNHLNICILYDVGPHYLVMELVEGPTLADRIKEGPVPLDEALTIARQIADALEAAHDKGIVHRDLKPANIKIKPDGTVKVLDFGLAKTLDSPITASPLTNPENSPTINTPTTAGVILGTVGYMPPEQIRGKVVDKRADIWAFGVVLYEMLAGKRPFQGEEFADILASVVKDQPDLGAVPAETRRLIERCLEKNPRKRLRDIGDMALLLEQAPETAPARDAQRARFGIAGWSAAALLAVGLGPVAFRHFREKPPAPAPLIRFQIPAPENTTMGPYLTVAPDGRKVAFLAKGQLWVHFLESGESRNLTAAEGSPFWSPDSLFIGYPSQGKLKKIEATGGPPQTVAEYNGSWEAGAWSRGGVMVFGAFPGGLFRVPASGGVPVAITAIDPTRQQAFHYCPSFLPDGRHFVYTSQSSDGQKDAIYLGDVDLKPEQQSSKALVASHWGSVYAPSADPRTGYLLFVREGTLKAQPFDNRRLELKDQAVTVAEQVGDNLGGAGGYGAFSASADDVLVFWPGAALDRQLTWYDREGKVLGTIGDPGNYQDLALAPDGKRAAVSKKSGAAANIWMLDLARGGSARFTFDAAAESDPVWSPDGSRIIFSSNRDGPYNLYQKLSSGEKDEEALLKSSEAKYATSWSRDGRFLLYTVVSPRTKHDIWVLPLQGDQKPVPFLITPFDESQARFSPDGHWVAYSSYESGQSEVYVRSFSLDHAGTPVDAGGKWQISNGGMYPAWRRDGRELYYRSRDGGLMAVEIATTPTFQAGPPQPLGTLLRGLWRDIPWDPTADGRRFLAPAAKSGSEPYTVVLNWQATLKK